MEGEVEGDGEMSEGIEGDWNNEPRMEEEGVGGRSAAVRETSG